MKMNHRDTEAQRKIHGEMAFVLLSLFVCGHFSLCLCASVVRSCFFFSPAASGRLIFPPPEHSMLTLLGSPRRTCDGITRRETLAAGALTFLGGAFNLPSLLAAETFIKGHARTAR